VVPGELDRGARECPADAASTEPGSGDEAGHRPDGVVGPVLRAAGPRDAAGAHQTDVGGPGLDRAPADRLAVEVGDKAGGRLGIRRSRVRLDAEPVGALLDDEGKLAILPTAARAVHEVPPVEWATYAPIAGTPEFLRAVIEDLLGGEPGRNWDWKRTDSRRGFFPGAPNVMGDLAEAMVSNPHLQVEVENGYYDMATPFFATEFTMTHLGLPAKLQGHIQENYYEAGHMMYVNEPSLAKLT